MGNGFPRAARFMTLTRMGNGSNFRPADGKATRRIDITPKELEILKVLIDNKGLVLSRNQILDEVWGYDCDVIDRTIDAYIRNIRKKLRLDCITTVKGIGYKFEMGQAI